MDHINKLEMEVLYSGMITENQAIRSRFIRNHNLDTSEEYYKSDIHRGFEDRLQTIENVRKTNVTF
jgi:biotin synthase